MAIGAFGRALILGFVATLAEGVTRLHAPLLVLREVGALVAVITFQLGLMLGMGEYRRFLGCLGLQGDLGRTFLFGENIAGYSKTEQKCECSGTDNGLLHRVSPVIQLVIKSGFMTPHSLTNAIL